MKRKTLTICIVFAISMILGMGTVGANEQSRYVGLHDKLLAFSSDEVRLHEGNMIVPFNKIAKYLYADITETEEMIRVTKNGFEIAYNDSTGKTVTNGTEVEWKPVLNIDGTLFIGLRYIAEEFGFKLDYLSNIRTARIYSADYPHFSHTRYANVVRPIILERNKPKPAVKANVYLTFDDGPTIYTKINVETFKKYNVYGTFFFIGKQMKIYPTIIKLVASNGHYIGTHSMTHDQAKVYKSSKSFMDEMNASAEMLYNITGEKSNLLRVPYGSVPHLTTAMKNELKKNNYKIWDWDVDSNDWRYTVEQTNEIMKNVQNGINKAYKSGDRDIVILLHDHAPTAKVLPQMIEWIEKEGYALEKYDPAHHVVQNFHRDPDL